MREIPLTQGKVAVVDDADYEWLSRYRWMASMARAGYWRAVRWVGTRAKHRAVFMHREIIGAQPGQLVDHRNGDGLDNRRANLRACSSRQNQQNRRGSWAASGYKGVHQLHRLLSKPWVAQIQVEGRSMHLGYFATPEEAAEAYDAAATTHFGDFAYLNFPAERTCRRCGCTDRYGCGDCYWVGENLCSACVSDEIGVDA